MTSPSILRRAQGRAAGATSKPKSRRAVLAEPLDGFFHVTPARNLDSILERGLLVKPPARLYDRESGHDATIGGVYLVPERQLDRMVDMICADSGEREVAVLTVRVEAGTQFCLDEDEVSNLAGLDPKETRKLSQEAFGGSGLVADAIVDCWRRGYAYDCARGKLDKWSCLLAQVADPAELHRFKIRVFSPPTILGVKRTRCMWNP